MNILIHPAQFPVQNVTYRVLDGSGAISPYVRYRITTRERKVFEGVTDHAGISQPVPTRYPEAMSIEFPNTLVTNPEEQ
jgi:hypothetical protein